VETGHKDLMAPISAGKEEMKTAKKRREQLKKKIKPRWTPP
jgi:hypothetical protein